MDKLDVVGLVGGKFVNGGRDVRVGLDCWGLVMEVYRRYGMELPDFTVDAFAFKAIDALASGAVRDKTWEEVWEPGDKDVPLVVLMHMHPVFITHVGVLVGRGRILHTTRDTGVVISRTVGMNSQIVGYYRYVPNNQYT